MSNSPTDPPNFDAAADQADSATRLMELWRSISSDRSMLHSSKICKLLWFRAFGDASVFRRVVVVAYRDDIERWRKTMKKSGDQGDDAAEVVFAQYDYRTRFNDTINDFTLNFDFQSGDIVVILPSTNYQSISMLGRGDSGRDSYGPIRPLISGSSNSILLAGLCDPRRNNGRIVVAATREDDILMRVDDGGRACLLNVQLEPQATSYGGCVIVEPGSAPSDTSWADDIVTQGEHPAISLSYACDLCLDQCTIRNNYGYAIQWADVDEENGTTDQKLIDEGTPAEFADKSAADREKSVSNAIFARFIKDNLGIDVRTEEGKKQMREREIKTRTEELAEIPAKRKRGSVVCMDCICKANARSAHLDDGADEMTGDIIPIQPWFREGSRMKKVLDSRP
eukprot:CAMPEP_0178495940 /NCGR_PEP_ID=MMETSP0696-20121128/13833_1 /TAXON_ID=265572 /ORGANISM="Extubocellulus spinifer, Strain CCMP396" /LENGTH=395 /DNA_ID=CAMNT_0020124153 /DNA_START=114 /DNA_END=1300 /DNA_ORIENTATION=-